MADPATKEVDLSGVLVRDADKKSLADIVDDFDAQVAAVRSRKDARLESTRSMFRRVPYLLLNPLLKAVSFFSYTLNLDLSFLGIPRDPFGSMMITNIGSLGLEEAFVPLVPYSRVPLLVALGAVHEAPVAENGSVAIR